MLFLTTLPLVYFWAFLDYLTARTSQHTPPPFFRSFIKMASGSNADLFRYRNMTTSAYFFYLLVSTINLVRCSLQKKQQKSSFEFEQAFRYFQIFSPWFKLCPQCYQLFIFGFSGRGEKSQDLYSFITVLLSFISAPPVLTFNILILYSTNLLINKWKYTYWSKHAIWSQVSTVLS